jgi:hypothetical protein
MRVQFFLRHFTDLPAIPTAAPHERIASGVVRMPRTSREQMVLILGLIGPLFPAVLADFAEGKMRKKRNKYADFFGAG